MGIMATLVDERGRILVPKDLRVQFGLEPGAAVIIEADVDGVKLRRAIPRQQALAALVGAIPKSKTSHDALSLKHIWELDHDSG